MHFVFNDIGHTSVISKYNKNYQNVNSKRLQLTTVYFLTLNGHLALFLFFFKFNYQIFRVIDK
jgi:hypothetical protein